MINCNIIIPTYNRPDYLRRILGYYDSFGEGFDIIVADSSSDENKRINQDTISSVSNLHIQYLDDYPAEINPYYKFANSLNYVNTEYCTFCADDDFVTPNGIKESVDFLEKNPDFIIAQGRYIGFRLESSKGKKQQFRWHLAYSTVSIEFSEPASRLEYHLSNYSTITLYGVHRTEPLKMIYGEALKFKVDPFLFYELLTTMLTLIYGKMKCLDVLYGARDAEPVRGRYLPTLSDAIEAGIFDEKYARFRDCLATHLSKKSRLGIEESGKLVDRAFSAYLHSHLLRPVVPIPKSKKRTLLDSLHLPLWMYDGIIASYATLHKVVALKPKSLYGALLVKPVFSLLKNSDDFNKIRLHVLSHSGTVYGKTASLSTTS